MRLNKYHAIFLFCLLADAHLIHASCKDGKDVLWLKSRAEAAVEAQDVFRQNSKISKPNMKGANEFFSFYSKIGQLIQKEDASSDVLKCPMNPFNDPKDKSAGTLAKRLVIGQQIAKTISAVREDQSAITIYENAKSTCADTHLKHVLMIVFDCSYSGYKLVD